MTKWVAAQLVALQTAQQDDIKEAETDLGREVLRFLHTKNIDTEELENAVADTRSLEDGAESEVLVAITNLRSQIMTILTQPSLQCSLDEMKRYYGRIINGPSLSPLNGSIHLKCLEFIANPGLEHEERFTEELRRLFIDYLQKFLAEEEALLEFDGA